MGRTSDARERLIEAAIDLIWPASYGAIGVDAICVKAGVKKGSFYHFFKGKDDLVVAALDAHWEGRRAVLDGVFSPAVPPLSRLQRYFAHIYVRQTEVREKYGRVLGCFHNSVGTECIQALPAIAAKVQEVLASYKRYLETALRDAQATGEVRAGDPAADAAMLFAHVEGVLTQARIHDDPELLRRLPEAGFALIGLTPPPAPSGSGGKAISTRTISKATKPSRTARRART